MTDYTDHVDRQRKILKSVAAKTAHRPKVDANGYPVPDQPRTVIRHDPDTGLYAGAQTQPGPDAT